MTDALGAIAVGIMIVLGSMLVGGILYIVIRDSVKHNIHRS
jgi:hypothetical protein